MGSLTTQSSPQTLPYQQLSFKEKLQLVREIAYNSLSNVASCASGPLVNAINLYFLSKYNNDDLVAGYGLGLVYEGALVLALIVSLNQAGNVLMSQAFGAKNYQACGIYFQKSVVLLALVVSPLIISMLFADRVMIAFSIDEKLAEILVSYSRISLFSFIGTACFDSMKSFITSQKVFYPIVYIQLINFGLHFCWAKIFIDWLQLGVQGAAICRVIDEWINTALIYLFIKRSNLFWKTWIPWTKEALDKPSLWNQLKFSIPIAAMSYCSWVYFEVMTLVAGTFGTTDVVAHVAVANTSATNFQISQGIAMTMMTYIANAVGKQSINEAKNFFYTGISMLVTYAVLMLCILLPNLDSWSRMWSMDPNTQSYMIGAVTIYCLSGLWIDTINNGQFGLLRAIGKQKVASYIAFLTLYPVGGPLMILFAFAFDMKVSGLWLAFGLSNFIGGVLCMYQFLNVNWETVLLEAQERLKEGNNEDKELSIDLHSNEKIQKLLEQDI